MTQPLWQPSAAQVAAANLTRFMKDAAKRWKRDLPDFAALYRWSVEKPEEFWVSVWEFGGVIAETRGERVLVDGGKMPGAQVLPGRAAQFRREPAAPARRRRRDRVLGRGQGEAAPHPRASSTTPSRGWRRR